MRHSGSTERQNSTHPARQSVGMPQHRSLSATTILAILREQAVPDSEARRRVNSDPILRAELAGPPPSSRSHH